MSISLFPLLCFSFLALVHGGKVWKTLQRSDAVSSFQMIDCARECSVEVTVKCAVLENNGTCLCDRCHKRSSNNTYMLIQGYRPLKDRSAIFSPFTSDYGIQSVGTESVNYTIYGSSATYTANRPDGVHPGKIMRYTVTANDSFHLTIPNTLRTRMENNGFIMALWIKLISVPVNMRVLDFYVLRWFIDTGNFRVRNSYDDADLVDIQWPADTQWHHIGIVKNPATSKVSVYQDAVLLDEQTYVTTALTDELMFGRNTGDMFIYCFVILELQADTVVADEILQTRIDCDDL